MDPEQELLEMTCAGDVEAASERMYGASLATTGVVQPAAVWRRDAGSYVTMRIHSETPSCAHDFFVLNLTRARADAILTTGKILREEPRLEHRLQGPGRQPEALLDWRRSRGKRRPPVTLVLTSGRDLDLAHPVFNAWTRPVVYTGRRGGWLLESRAADHGVEVVAVDEPSVRGAIELLRYQFGAATISIEAGPSVARELYQPPVVVDELLLSVYEGPELPESVRGRRFPDAAELGRIFRPPSPTFRVDTWDGAWSFRRFLR